MIGPKAPGRWRAIVADDEPAARRGVRQLLAAFPDFEVVAECRDGREVLVALDQARPDVLFLDIQMPEIDGFAVIRQQTARRMPALVVFLTAYDNFAIRAFEAEALDYLVKPVSEARFAATMDRIVRRLQLGAASGPAAPIVVPTARGALVIPLPEIDWIEAAGNYARVWTRGTSHLLRESLDTLEERLAPNGFARAHRAALVRVGSVRVLEARDDGELVAMLATGAEVPISRRRRAAFAEAVRRQRA